MRALDAQPDLFSGLLDGVDQGGSERRGGKNHVMSLADQLQQPFPDRAHLESHIVAEHDARRVDTAVSGNAGHECAEVSLLPLDDDRLPGAHARLAVTGKRATSSPG